MHERKTVWVCDGPKRIATISAVDTDDSANRSHATALWTARIHHKQFDPFSHSHEPSEEGEDPVPHISASDDGLLALHNPNSLSLSDARSWVRDNYTGGKTNAD
jgi:hypothetical protein